MLQHLPSRRTSRSIVLACVAALCTPVLFVSRITAQAQSNPANAPVSIPTGLIPEPPPAPKPKPPPPAATISAKQLRQADDAYLEGAKQIEHKDLAAAERSFERAVQLDPNNRDYALALIVARESRVTELVQSAARARLKGDITTADSLLEEARKLDPENRLVTQHFDTGATPLATPVIKPGLLYSHADPSSFPAADIASTLAGPVELKPRAGAIGLHLHGDPTTVIRTFYNLFGITAVFDSSVSGGPTINIDVDKATFAEASHIVDLAAHVFAVPVQPKVVLVAKDTQEKRDELTPEIEETVYLPGLTNDAMQELANLARNVFDLKQVSASATGGYLLLRGDEDVLREVNATYADMLDGGSEVLFDVTLYELDKTLTRDIGAALPSSAGVFSVFGEAQSIISANQSTINQAVSAGLLTLNGSYIQNTIAELEFLIGSGAVTASQFTNLLGVFGNGLTFAGLFLGSNSDFNLLLNSTDVHTLDSVQIRSSNRQPTNFRAGSRYPVITGTYTSGIGNTLPASLAGLNINGTSAASLLQQYLGSSSVSVPQFQFEDLGITLKLTPQILHNSEVTVALEMKIEALAGSSLNNIPILNNRALTSTFTVPVGSSAMIASFVSTNELKSLTGLPGLSELPGFQGTDQDREKDRNELLITITPHIVRTGRLNVASRRLATVKTGPSSGSSSNLTQGPL